jgi:DNA-binding NarL/FixJ family response regulator
LLGPGDRVWARVPGSGFVGVGRVAGRVRSAADFVVTTPAGEAPVLEDAESVLAAMRAGARGYVLKDAEGEETLRAIRAAAGGEAIFSPTIARRLADYFGTAETGSATPPEQPQGEQKETPASEYPAGLTSREVEVLKLVAEGLTNAQIAERLYLSPRTVHRHLSSVYRKLGTNWRAAAARFATERGLIP